MPEYPIILHVPHSSTYIPEEIKAEFIISNDELEHEILVMTDHYMDAFVQDSGYDIYKSRFSRLVFDAERFREDIDEPMAERGIILSGWKHQRLYKYSI